MLEATPTAQAAAAAAAAARPFGTVVADNLPFLLQGLGVTVQLAALALLLSLALGLVFGVLRVAPLRPLRATGTAYVEFFRNTPLLVQMYFWFFGLPWLIGVTLPGFQAGFLALGIYTGAFVAEVVRAGILAVSRGQTEAAHALGLRPGPTLRLVVIPQAMRVIIPPLTSQYLNLAKNSSLAVAIGYPDLVQVFMGTVLNQTGQAIEVVAITMAVYLTISLTTSFFMNIYNQRVAIVER